MKNVYFKIIIFKNEENKKLNLTRAYKLNL